MIWSNPDFVSILLQKGRKKIFIREMVVQGIFSFTYFKKPLYHLPHVIGIYFTRFWISRCFKFCWYRGFLDFGPGDEFRWLIGDFRPAVISISRFRDLLRYSVLMMLIFEILTLFLKYCGNNDFARISLEYISRFSRI